MSVITPTGSEVAPVRSPCLLAAVVALNLAGQAAGQQPSSWTLEPLHSIGDAHAASGETAFHDVPEEGLAGRPGGGLLVLDAGNHRILEFDDGGRLLASHGREGDGPGDFRFPLSLDVGPDGSVWTYDARTGRFTVLHRGEIRTVSAPERLFGRLRVGGEGRIYQALAQPVTRAGSRGTSSPAPLRRVVRIDADGGEVVPVWDGTEPSRRLLSLTEGTGVVQTRVREEFAPEARWDLLSDGTLVTSDTTAYLVTLITPEGVTTRLGTSEDGRLVTEADRRRRREELREELWAEQEDRSPAFRKSRRLIEEQVDQTPFGPRIPTIGGLLVDGEDRIWVGVLTDDAAELDRIDVWTREGGLVGTIPDPPGFPHALYGDRAAMLVEDAFGVQGIQVFGVLTP